MATKSPNLSQADSQPSPPARRRSLFARSSSKPGPKKKENNSVSPSPQPTPINPANPSQSTPATPSSQISTSPSTPPPPPSTTSPDGQIKLDTATSNLGAGSQQGPVPTTSQAPVEQVLAQATETSTTTVASLPGTSTSAHPTSEPADDTDREKEKDKGSLATTLTGTHNTRVSRKGAQTASDGAHSSTAAEKPPSLKSAAKRRVAKPQSSSPRVSFISRLFRSLVPCVGPSRLPNEAVDDVVSDPNSSAAAALRDKSARDAEKDPSLRPVPETLVTNESDTDQPHPGTEPSSLPLVPTIEIPSQQLNVTPPELTILDNNLDIVVPPTPTKVIPESETGGVTSSAVVPLVPRPRKWRTFARNKLTSLHQGTRVTGQVLLKTRRWRTLRESMRERTMRID
jgi:RNA polymerase II subunit A small phosphatase-like protein